MARWAVGGAMGLTMLFLAACSTPESRIEKNPALYSSFSPEVQANVKKGKIEIGYTYDMVYVAWGQPSRKKTITEANVQREVWVYLSANEQFDGYDFIEVPRVDGQGRPAGVYLDQRPRYKTVYYERASVTFTSGKVSKIVQ